MKKMTFRIHLYILFQIIGTKLIEEPFYRNFTKFEITFDKTVTVNRSFYPSPSIYHVVAELGGCLGLWLGVGIVQISLQGLNIMGNTLQSVKNF